MADLDDGNVDGSDSGGILREGFAPDGNVGGVDVNDRIFVADLEVVVEDVHLQLTGQGQERNHFFGFAGWLALLGVLRALPLDGAIAGASAAEGLSLAENDLCWSRLTGNLEVAGEETWRVTGP